MALVVCIAGAPSLAAANNNFGVQDRANAASDLIVLAVQQTISSLPPTSSQSFEYEFSPERDTYVRQARLGPTVFRSPLTLGPGSLVFRLATSYFELDDTLGPIDYLVTGPFQPLTQLGLSASAQVTVIGLSVGYGISKRFEIYGNLPIVVTHARASEVFLSEPDSLAVVTVPLEPPNIIDIGLATGSLVLRTLPFTEVGADFPEGTNAGVGRISIGAKALLYSASWVQLGCAPEFFFPSPSEAQLAGSDSAAITPRLTAALSPPAPLPLKVYAEAAYEYDFSNDELRHFSWAAGPSVSYKQGELDVGLSGSVYNSGITWTPTHAAFTNDEGTMGTLTALENNRLGTTFVNFLFGLKVRVAEAILLAGAVTVPLDDQPFRPTATGTLALEVHL